MTAPTVGTTRVVLWGPDHVEQGAIAVEAPEREYAVAMSRGGPKSPPPTDPNEDVVAIVGRGDRVLLAVADGHHGRQASIGAVDHLLTELDPPPWTLEPDAARELLARAARAAQRAVEDGANPRSRSTLTVALVSGRALWWASIGDSAVYLVDGRGARRLDTPTERYLGGPVRLTEVREAATTGAERLDPGSWVCVASDGFSDFARPTPLVVLGAALGFGPVAGRAARRLVEVALGGGAGDNVGVAVAHLRADDAR